MVVFTLRARTYCIKVIYCQVLMWLMPVILATQEAKIRRTVVPHQPRQIVLEILAQNT
jgi:hypothetical protein